MRSNISALILAAVVGGVAFQAGRLSAPPMIDHRVVLRLPRPNHIWLGFNPDTRSAYYINNGNHLTIHAMSYRVSRMGTNGARTWDVHFEENVKPLEIAGAQ